MPPVCLESQRELALALASSQDKQITTWLRISQSSIFSYLLSGSSSFQQLWHQHELYKQDLFQVQQQHWHISCHYIHCVHIFSHDIIASSQAQQQPLQEVSGKQQHSFLLFRAALYVTVGEALRMNILQSEQWVWSTCSYIHSDKSTIILDLKGHLVST